MAKRILKVAICDDSVIDRKIVKKILDSYFAGNSFLNCQIYEYESGEDFMQGPEDIDLVFMDIMMPGISGMDVARRLVDEDSDTRIVFTTSSVEYVTEGYDVSALHYLVKPFKSDKLIEVLDKFVSRLKSVRTIELKVGREKKTFFTDDIYWVESANHNSIAHLSNDEIIISGTLGEISDELLAVDFVRINRFSLVNMRHISTVPTDVVVLDSGEEIKITRKEIDRIKNCYLEYVNEGKM